jgi:hypothetical protein
MHQNPKFVVEGAIMRSTNEKLAKTHKSEEAFSKSIVFA